MCWMVVDLFDVKFDVFRWEFVMICDWMYLFYEYVVLLVVDVSKCVLVGLLYCVVEIGLLVLVISIGFIVLGVDVVIVKEFGFFLLILCVVVNFMGCVVVMNVLGIVINYVCVYLVMKVLVVCIELCLVNVVFVDDINDVVIYSLFGDGCVVLVIGVSQVQEKFELGKVVVCSSFSQLFDNIEDGIVFGVNYNGIICELLENFFGYIFSGVVLVVIEMLWDNGLQIFDIDFWVIYLGGFKIIEQLVCLLGIFVELVVQSWDVFVCFGNMFSVLFIFVLEMMVQQVELVKVILMGVVFVFGLGVIVEGMLFDII